MDMKDAIDNLQASTRQQGVIEGLKLAVATARKQSGECYAVGQDEDAEKYRTLARMIGLELTKAEKDYDDNYLNKGQSASQMLYGWSGADLIDLLINVESLINYKLSAKTTLVFYYEQHAMEWRVARLTDKKPAELKFTSQNPSHALEYFKKEIETA